MNFVEVLVFAVLVTNIQTRLISIVSKPNKIVVLVILIVVVVFVQIHQVQKVFVPKKI